jgi:acyl-CoA synthetase (AMP-forming)/AMP-acid ligase II
MDRYVEEAAMDLGANEWTTFRKVTLPMIAPGVAAAALLAAAIPHTAEAGEVINGARTRMSRKPAALARELLRNFPKGRGKAKRRRRRKGAEIAAPETALVPAATAEAIDQDGWLHTGDLGTLDERGHLRIVGRKKDMFIVGGFNAYPAEIEGFLLEHPAVAQVAVIGVPDERLGQVGKAFVVRDGEVSAEELIAWSRERMAGFKVPRFVEFLDELPLNATGKVMKDRLR